ncbi:MAG TPA: glycosyltransferase family 2 protein [Gemmatimonadaceae bacterium]|nr:glycosyltransferase family 2 protein [Gemmatimonadaceae bacterium]
MALTTSFSPVTLSVIVPCYNEEATIDGTLDALEELEEHLAPEGIALEVIAVDDRSTDDTLARLRSRATGREGRLVVARHERNLGKGAAIVTARQHATGDIVLIQDADLEYDPSDVPTLIGPILDGRADAVLGSRFGGSGAKRVLYFWHRVGNGGLTLLSNMFTDLNVTDMETGYKAFSAEVFRVMHLTNRRFGIEPEMVARLSQMGARVYEVPISYHGRTYAEGKKITWRDGLAAILHIVRARLTASSQRRLPPRRVIRTPSVVRAIAARGARY